MKDEDCVFVVNNRKELKKQQTKKLSYSKEILVYFKANISSKIVISIWVSAILMGVVASVLIVQGKDIEAYALTWMLVTVFFMMDP